jgi:hypothetical protein
MFDKREIRAAVEAGVLGREEADRFEAFLKTRSDPDRLLDAENLRFLTNFNDVFLSIGLGVLLTGVAVLSGQLLNGLFSIESQPRLVLGLAPLAVLATAWGLAEYFTGRRRLLLPSMLLSVVICICAAMSASAFLFSEPGGESFEGFSDVFARLGYVGAGAAALAALAVRLRFKLPFSLFLLASSVAMLFYVGVADLANGDMSAAGLTMLIAGLLTLAAAIWYDAKDPSRSSLWSDSAFWLHFAAAPQIMMGLRGMILGFDIAPNGVVGATTMLLVLLAFAILSLALNRRALIVSGLISFATALGFLISNVGRGDAATTMMLTAILIGGAIVLLGGGWRTARRALLNIVPHRGFAGRIFPPEPA